VSHKPDAWPGDEPDWYGEKSKRKNEHPARNERIWGIVSILASLAITVAGCAIISIIVFDPFNRRAALINTPEPTVIPILTATPIPFQSATPKLPTALPTPTQPLPKSSMTLRVFNQNGDYLWSLFGEDWKAGYLLRGLNWTGGQFVAQTRGIAASPCEESDTFWNIGSGRQLFPNFGKIVNPKSILPLDGWTIILATDCTRQGASLFLLDSINNLRDIFPIIGGDALIQADGRIFVSLSGFAGGDQQNHWIELKIDESSKLAQVEQYTLDDANAVYRSAAYDANTGLAFIRSKPGLEMLQIAELKENTLTVRKTVSLTIALTDLQFSKTGELFALDRRNKAIVRFNSSLSDYTTIPLKGITPYSFALDANGNFVIAGYAE